MGCGGGRGGVEWGAVLFVVSIVVEIDIENNRCASEDDDKQIESETHLGGIGIR